MTEEKRIALAKAMLLAVLAAMAGLVVALVTVGSIGEFTPGTGVFAPLPAGESGLHLPLGGER